MIGLLKRSRPGRRVRGRARRSSREGSEVIKVDGSSTVYPITEAVAEEFGSETRATSQVTVGISGTGGGFKKFVRGETDISDASRPILEEEMEDAQEERHRVHRAAGRLRRADRRRQPARTLGRPR